MQRVDEVWKEKEQVEIFLEGIRDAIPFFEDQLRTMMRLIEGLPVRSFLDLGCGDGILAERILRAYPGARGTLLDFSLPMLEKARKNLEGYCAALNFVEADLAKSDWPDKAGEDGKTTFDLVVSSYAIHHQSETVKKSIYKALYGLLNPGGFFVNIDHVASRDERIRNISNDFFIDSLRTYHEQQEGPGDFQKVRQLFLKRMAEEAPVLSTVSSQCRWLSECGFVEVDCFFKVFELAVFGGRRPG
ncbi:MAG: methyltransferase domain-containing protein [Thermodesulfobacteriota bacterium]